MITKIFDLEDNLITDLVNTAILNPDVIHIKNRLLDGTYHIQTIGEAITVIDCIIYADAVNKAKIDYLYTRGEPVKLDKLDKWYKGIITELGGWKVFVVGELYEVSFKIFVSDSGVV